MTKLAEIFKSIPNYKGLYEASTYGRIKSLARVTIYPDGHKQNCKERILRLHLRGSYLVVNLHKGGKHKPFKVHQLVAITFLDHKPNGHAAIIDHLDSDPLNNNVDNLRVTTNRINTVRGKTCQNTSSKYVGVYFSKAAQQFRGRIWINGKSVNLGLSDSELTLSVRYQRKLIQIGEFIRTGTIMDFVKVIDPADTKPVDGLYELA